MNAGATKNRRKHIPMKNIVTTLAALAAVTVAAQAAPQIKVTEVMYTGLFGEFVEITNTGDASQSMTGWSFSDNSRTVGETSIAGIGTLDAGEVAVITEVSDTIFIQAWYTEPTNNPVTLAAANIVENNVANLGRSDEVNIYDNTSPTPLLVDRVTYNDQASNGPRSEDVSAVPKDTWNFTLANMGTDWVLSTDSQVAGEWKAGVAGASGPIGSPGLLDLADY